MNVNSAHFHLLLGDGDWGACTSVGAKPAALAKKWKSLQPDDTIPIFDAKSLQLTLQPLEEPIPATPGEPLFTAADRRDAVADRNGNLYVIADDRLGLTIRSAGSGVVTSFWPPAPRRRRRETRAFADAAPVETAPRILAGLTITSDDFLIVGAGGSLLRFDLVGGGPPDRAQLPDGIVAAALAPAGDGGLWLLDATSPRLFRLDANLCIEARRVPGEAAIFAPDGIDPAPGFTAEPVTIDTSVIPAPAGLVALSDGAVILLDAPVKTAAGLFILDPGASAIRSLIRLDIVAFCFAATEPKGMPALLLADTDGNQAWRVQLVQRNGRWEASPQSDTLPLRRFGGRALVPIQGNVHYDSGATDPIWVQVIAIPHRRYALSAGFVTPVHDSGVPQCVWDRIWIDGCIPPGATVRVEARAADDSRTFATQATTGWIAQPALVLSPSGSELTGKRAIAAVATDPRNGKGSWGLLLQGITGRYTQLRITLIGDGRITPRLRALRIWYPRFSYVQRFLPGVYREEPVSASFLERFLANFEGLNTMIEDRIATAEALFDPRIAPVEMLDWLASWYEVALDPAWDERRRRLFIAHAAAFFGWRGTIRGLQLALKLALDETITAADFTLDGPDCTCPGAIRIVEAYRNRPRSRRFPKATDIPAPGIRSLDGDWLPEEGAAGLWARWPEGPAPAGRFPLFPLAGKEAIWTALVQQQLGFVPSVGQAERARWQAFQASIGIAAPEPDLPAATSDVWERYAALPTHDRQAWQDFLRARYRTIDLLNAAHDTLWSDFTLVPLPDHLPATATGARDWLMFEGQEMPIDRAAHRFSVLLPRTRVDTDPDTEATQIALARRIVGLEKPAHTVFDVRFYWAMNRVGEARLGLDSAIGQGSRAPELVPAAVLGRAYAGATFIGGPAIPPTGRSRIAC
ncbi:hypothetical protein GCM10009087_47510 [Sphingomonas oligophenolica]|uniref:Phage tail protein n=1 Tax=Sphingomonas oligophenolica TaxID=301154 RepID=A0ABU9Y7J4_9SPHN